MVQDEVFEEKEIEKSKRGFLDTPYVILEL